MGRLSSVVVEVMAAAVTWTVELCPPDCWKTLSSSMKVG